MPEHIEQEVKWYIGGGSEEAPAPTPKLPYVGTWKTFSKLEEDEKERIFNSMRGDLVLSGRMLSK